MTQQFFLVPNKIGNYVQAKTLVDASGNDIINPNSGQPFVVPLDYSIEAAIAFGKSLKTDIIVSPDGTMQTDAWSKAVALVNAFVAGGVQDLQRSYNGMVGGGGDDFVQAFKDAASFNLGVVATAAGFSPTEIIAGGGLYNLSKSFDYNLNTSGPWWNAPENADSIKEGISVYNSGRCDQRRRGRGLAHRRRGRGPVRVRCDGARRRAGCHRVRSAAVRPAAASSEIFATGHCKSGTGSWQDPIAAGI